MLSTLKEIKPGEASCQEEEGHMGQKNIEKVKRNANKVH
jgi:hypothetical protein